MRALVASLSKKIISSVFAATLAMGLMPAAAFADAAVPEEREADAVAGDDALVSSDDESSAEDVAQAGDGADLAAGEIINQEMPLETVAQAESTRSFFLAQTLESTRTVPMVSAKLPLDDGVGAAFEASLGDSADGRPGGTTGEEGGGTSGGPAVAAASTVVGSFERLGMTFAIEADGESVALVAVDYSKLPEESVEKQVLVVPELATPDGIDIYSVSRIASGALSGLTADAADPAFTGCEALFFDEELMAEAGVDPEEAAALPSSAEKAVEEDNGVASDMQAEAGTSAHEAQGGAASREVRAIVSMDGNVAALDDGSTYEFTNPLAGKPGILALGIPASAATIEDDAFEGADTLQYLVVSGENPSYASFDGALYSADLRQLLLIPEGRLGAVRVAPSAAEVSPEVFSHCPSVDALVADPDGAIHGSILPTSLIESNAVLLETVDREAQEPNQMLREGKRLFDVEERDAKAASRYYLSVYTFVSCVSYENQFRDGVAIPEGVGLVHYGSAFGYAYGRFDGDAIIVFGSHPNGQYVSLGRKSGEEWYNLDYYDWQSTEIGKYITRNLYWDSALTQPVAPGEYYQNVDVFLGWGYTNYTVAYDANGGFGSHASAANLTMQNYLTLPSAADCGIRKTGYTLSGWTLNGQTYGPGETVYMETMARGVGCGPNVQSDHITLSACWTPNTYSLGFDANGGSGGQSSVVVATYDAGMPGISPYPPERVGYTFDGWYDTSAPSGGTQYYTAGGASARGWDKDHDAVLYARWVANAYSIAWNANGGSVAVASDVATQTYGNSLKLPANPTRRGYKFAGWWTAATGGQQVGVSGGIVNVEARNAEYFARWTAVEGKVALNAAASTDAEHAGARFSQSQVDAWNAVASNPKAELKDGGKSVELTYGPATAAFLLDALRPSLLGSTFGGWDPAVSSFDPASTPSWNAASESYGAAAYAAKWTTNAYSITYEFENQDGNALAGASTADGSSLPMGFNEATSDRSLPAMQLRGYTWKGWTYEGSPVTAIPDVSKNVTLVGHFEADPYPVEVDLDGGTQTGWHDGSFVLTYDDPVLRLPGNDAAIKKPGYVLKGFETYAGGESPVTVYEKGSDGAWTVAAALLQPGGEYKVLGLQGDAGIYDISSIKAVWVARIAVDVPQSVSLGIMADTASDSLRFQSGGTVYAGSSDDAYAPVSFVSYTTAPVGIVEVADSRDEAMAELAAQTFRGKEGSVSLALSPTRELAHKLALGGKTELPDGAAYLPGLKVGAASAGAPVTTTFYLGMDFGGLKASDLQSGLSGDIAKLSYTVCLLGDDGSQLEPPSELPVYDGEGILW